MRWPDVTARTVLQAYGSADRRTRYHAACRWVTCPFEAVERLVPRSGRVLDLGCGFGHFAIYLAMCSSDREVVGVDIDRSKVGRGLAAVAQADLNSRVRLEVVDAAWSPPGETFDAVVAVDVLYLLGSGRADAILEASADAVLPGGSVVVKEMGRTPPWKYAVNTVQERLATGPLGITQGAALEVLSRRQLESPLHRRGLSVRWVELDKGYPHPHLAVVGER